jgi:hypothetical protein
MPAPTKETMPLFQPEEPTSFDVLESMISRVGNVETSGPMRMFSVTVPYWDFCTIGAMSQFSGQPKTKIVAQMIKVCIERLTEEMGPEDLHEIALIRQKLIDECMAEETAKGNR